MLNYFFFLLAQVIDSFCEWARASESNPLITSLRKRGRVILIHNTEGKQRGPELKLNTRVVGFPSELVQPLTLYICSSNLSDTHRKTKKSLISSSSNNWFNAEWNITGQNLSKVQSDSKTVPDKWLKRRGEKSHSESLDIPKESLAI